MNDNWFDFADDLANGFFNRPDRFDLIRQRFGLPSKKMERKKLKSWGSVNEINNILDSSFFGNGKLWDSVVKDSFLTKSRFSEEPVRIRELDTDDFFTKARRLRNRIVRERLDSESEVEERSKRRTRRNFRSDSEPEKSPSCSSANSYGFTDVTNDLNKYRKGSVDDLWGSRKSSIQGNVNVTFPTSSSSNVSEASYCGKSIDRSLSRNSDDSVCTEKSANCTSVTEKLPDGTDKTQTENNEVWVSKSSSGSRISEKKLNDSSVTEKNDNKISEKSSRKMSYVEKSDTGSSLQELMSENVSTSEKTGNKTIEQKTSSETIKKKIRRPSKPGFYEELEARLFSKESEPEDEEKTPVLRRREFLHSSKGKSVTEKISKLIDEAVEQDNLFRLPTMLQSDIDKIADDLLDVRVVESDIKGRRRPASFFAAGKTDQDLTWSKFNEIKAENEHLQQENSKLQSIIQDVTSVNKRWQKYNNERRLYVQKLLSTIQDLQEQINLISEKSAFRNNPQEESAARYDDIEKLKKEHQEHITVLELQIKSHKDDWDAERKEKRKAVQEKEELEDKVKELTRDINFLKNVLQEERNRKPTTCSMCKNKIEESSIFSKTEFLPSAASLRVSKTFLPKTFRTSVHVPYSSNELLSSDQCFFSEDDLSKERGESSQESSSYYSAEFSQIDESFRNEHFSRSTKFTQGKKTLSGETIVVEDESGIRLSITEQYPQKENMQLKSILKKNDKKLKLSSKSFSGQSDLKTDRALMFSPIRKPASMDEPNITCEEFESPQKECGLFIGFKDDGLARVTSFSPESIPASDESFQYLPSSSSENLQVNSKSKSEPNTRDNSPQNLQPTRESSSWNDSGPGDDTDTTENVVCPSCDRVFPPSTHLQFLDHFEICPNENDPF